MTDEQILKAMQSMLEPIKQDLSGLKQDMTEVKQDVAGLKQDVVGLKQDVVGLKQDMTEVKARVTKIELVQENKTNRNIQLLFEVQQGINTKFQRLDQMEMTLNAVKSDTEVIKLVVTEHSQSIRELKLVK